MIAEYTSKAYTFTTTPEQAKFLDSLSNKAEFIREAIGEKIKKEVLGTPDKNDIEWAKKIIKKKRGTQTNGWENKQKVDSERILRESKNKTN